jgi:hypothetical protein
MSRHAVTVIPGDGIGPECVAAAVEIVNATGVGIDWIEQHAGERVFKQGIASGVPQDTNDSISQTRVVLKGPLGTPVGFGEKSANVTLRKLFETFAWQPGNRVYNRASRGCLVGVLVAILGFARNAHVRRRDLNRLPRTILQGRDGRNGGGSRRAIGFTSQPARLLPTRPRV